jgi:acetyltransferase-like isoleucine patch superfamily enzyme
MRKVRVFNLIFTITLMYHPIQDNILVNILMKSSLLHWLAKKLVPFLHEKIKPMPFFSEPDLLLKPSFLGPEGCIENFAEESDRITVGKNSYVRGRLLTWGHGGSIKIGEWCYVGIRSEIWSMNSITIGNRVLISHNVNILDGTAHSTDPEERHAHYKHILTIAHPKDPPPGVMSAPIVIEDDVWINVGVTILKGVRIGKGSIIAAGAIVTEDVPPGVIYKCQITPQLTPLQRSTANANS